MNLAQATALTEDQAREYLENIRWPNGPVCPHCGSTEATRLTGTSTTPGTCKCKAKECRKKFTVRVGTIFESSHIPLRNWVIAFHLMCSSKKGISAHQIHRSLGCTYKTAWFMCHRIRHAMDQGSFTLTGTVEVDETYVGGKPRKGGPPAPRGGATSKAPVVVLVERDGKAIAKPMQNVTMSTLRKEMNALIARDAVLMTDESALYTETGKGYAEHHTVKHSAGEYGRRSDNGLKINNNTAESFFAMLKRGHYGVYHKMSKHHLFRYCNEFSFRWSHKGDTDSERRDAAIRGAEGKRLTYR